MRKWFCLMALCALGVSCHRETGPERPPAGIHPPQTNTVSKLDAKGRLAETLIYTTNGLLKQHTFFEIADDGRVLGTRTVDAEGKLKWTETFFYAETGGNRPIEIRRFTPNGKVIATHFRYAPDGTPKRIVFGPDGKEITAPEQKAFLDE